MSKRQPDHTDSIIADIDTLQLLITKLGFSREKFCQLCGIKYPQLMMWIKNKSIPKRSHQLLLTLIARDPGVIFKLQEINQAIDSSHGVTHGR